MYQLAMFDLDGTISDSGSGIMKSVQYALDAFGIKDEPEEKLRRFVGPSLMDSFTRYYDMKEEDALQAIKLYREVYEAGNLFDLLIYEGIPELLSKLRLANVTTVLVTSKPHVFAERILEKFGLKEYFTFMASPELTDPSSDKARLIEKALKKYPQANLKDAVMIGDTHFDIEGAVSTGVSSIGVTYGYGTRDELEKSGADIVVDSVRELESKLCL